VSLLQPDPPRIAGRRLAQLLGRWSDASRLDARRADAIRREIVASPAPSDFDRWWRLLDPVNGAAFRTNRTRLSAEIEPTLPSAIAPTTQHWLDQEPDFQPYLRL
jgi:hypothetical protein